MLYSLLPVAVRPCKSRLPWRMSDDVLTEHAYAVSRKYCNKTPLSQRKLMMRFSAALGLLTDSL